MKQDTNCAFCKVSSGELPSHKLYEDELVIAILSIDPMRPGHSLIIPKEHWRKVWQIEDARTYHQVMEIAQKIAQTLNKTFNPKHILEIVEGLEINHAHLHIIPAEKGYGEIAAEHTTKEPDHHQLDELARQIKANL